MSFWYPPAVQHLTVSAGGGSHGQSRKLWGTLIYMYNGTSLKGLPELRKPLLLRRQRVSVLLNALLQCISQKENLCIAESVLYRKVLM